MTDKEAIEKALAVITSLQTQIKLNWEPKKETDAAKYEESAGAFAAEGEIGSIKRHFSKME